MLSFCMLELTYTFSSVATPAVSKEPPQQPPAALAAHHWLDRFRAATSQINSNGRVRCIRSRRTRHLDASRRSLRSQGDLNTLGRMIGHSTPFVWSHGGIKDPAG